MVKLEVVNQQNHLRIFRKKLEHLAQLILKGEKSKKNELSILFCDNKEIKQYHKKWLNKATATDVISFEPGEPVMPGEEKYLGDLVVSAEMAKKVCLNYGQTAQQELLRYVAHGMLHLLGYDDHDPDDYEVMHGKQEDYLRKHSKLWQNAH